jgi:hypothetical protein
MNIVGRASVSLLLGAVLALATSAPALGSSHEEAAGVHVGRRFVERLDPWGLPPDLVLRLARAAVAAGMTKGQVARLLSDQRFAMAVGSGEGYRALEALARSPDLVARAYRMLFGSGESYTSSGATSFQSALFADSPELRNEYLHDLGLMVATRPDGVEVLVDLETGRQVIGQGKLGMQVTAPGGGPLPEPEVSPEEAAAAMWAAADAVPRELPPPGGRPFEAVSRPGGGTGAGGGLPLAAVYLFAGTLAGAWLGYGGIWLARRFRSR